MNICLKQAYPVGKLFCSTNQMPMVPVSTSIWAMWGAQNWSRSEGCKPGVRCYHRTFWKLEHSAAALNGIIQPSCLWTRSARGSEPFQRWVLSLGVSHTLKHKPSFFCFSFLFQEWETGWKILGWCYHCECQHTFFLIETWRPHLIRAALSRGSWIKGVRKSIGVILESTREEIRVDRAPDTEA